MAILVLRDIVGHFFHRRDENTTQILLCGISFYQATRSIRDKAVISLLLIIDSGTEGTNTITIEKVK